MSRWIAKTGNARSTWIAKVIVDDDHQPVILDDYIYQRYASHHRCHWLTDSIPIKWTPLARRIKIEVPDRW